LPTFQGRQARTRLPTLRTEIQSAFRGIAGDGWSEKMMLGPHASADRSAGDGYLSLPRTRRPLVFGHGPQAAATSVIGRLAEESAQASELAPMVATDKTNQPIAINLVICPAPP